MACTTSIGPGATNMVTAAAVAHVNRLPVLLLPGDVFANRAGPIRCCSRSRISATARSRANDCFRPVSRYFDRITRPEQIMPALPRALAVLTDPAECGPVTLAFCQDVQAEAFDYPETFFDERVHRLRRQRARRTRARARRSALLKRGQEAAGRVRRRRALFRGRAASCCAFCERAGIPVAETQAGKSATPRDHPLHMGAIGVTGTEAANASAGEADVMLAVGTRLADFTTGSWALFQNPDRRFIGLNVQPFDAAKHRGAAAGRRRQARPRGARRRRSATGARPAAWTEHATRREAPNGRRSPARYTARDQCALPSDAQVLGALMRGGAEERHRRLRRRRPAGRVAQALAGRRAARLSPRIRLFLHGLRDRRRRSA